MTLSSPTVTAGNGVLARVTLTGPAQSPSGGVIVYVDFRSTALAGPRFIRIDEIIVGNYFGSTFQGAYLSIIR